MIAVLEGNVEDITYESPTQATSPMSVILLCNGIGFQLLCSKHTCENITRGENAKLFVSPQIQIREGSMKLYGFFEKYERELFNLLVSVQGVGGKLALAILSYFDSATLAHAILEAEKNSLQKVPGLGARTAQRLISELEDKVSVFSNAHTTAYTTTDDNAADDNAADDIDADDKDAQSISSYGKPLWRDLLEALEALGFERAEISRTLKAMQRAKTPDNLEAAVRIALKSLRPHK